MFNHLKISKMHRGPHKTPSHATCGPRVETPAVVFNLTLAKSDIRKRPTATLIQARRQVLRFGG